ncbi:MAG: bifunctional folylpolyglutamate synthase/dihydrofolate synthase [Elusimicrobiota bacterium]|jgi:dihydrofolate synthase/folylpolyglutamate synthase|nr:bifunctional folylpolyglutamate synthase/dihydrofolate synthase [Elusimicrobiota bacterium]
MKYLNLMKEYEGMKPGLSRIKKFLQSVGNPQDSFKCVQIAGTNGKGSTAVFLSSILKEHGYKTGLYTSPHLIDITERIKIDGKDISQTKLSSILQKYFEKAKEYKLSYFEYLTAAAFIYFCAEEIDIAVLETGLGGRFDATNIVKNVLASIITGISFDHKEILGNTLSEIAYEKAGILKKKAFAISAPLAKPAFEQILKKSKPYVFGKDFNALNIHRDKEFQYFDYCGINIKLDKLKIAMRGSHQIQNCCLAICCAELLLGLKLEREALIEAVSNAKWDARFDIRKVLIKDKQIELIIDGAHNEEGIKSFIKTWQDNSYALGKKTFIFAMMKEKNYSKIIKIISPFASKIILPALDNQRAVKTSVLKKEFSKSLKAENIIETDNIESVFKYIKNNEKTAVIGSLYLAGGVLKFLNEGGIYE